MSTAGARHLADSEKWRAWHRDREEFDRSEPDQLPVEVPEVTRFSIADRLTDSERVELWEFRRGLPAL